MIQNLKNNYTTLRKDNLHVVPEKHDMRNEAPNVYLQGKVNIDYARRMKDLKSSVRGQSKEVSTLNKCTDVEKPVVYQDGSLHLAVAASDIVMVEDLLKSGIDVDALDKDQRTALHIAAEIGSVVITLLLLSYHAEVDKRGRKERTALHIAASLGYTELITLLLSYNSSIEAACSRGKRPLHMAAKQGHDKVVSLLLDRGAFIDAEDELQRTPIFLAAKHGHIKLVLDLFQCGANTNSEDNKGRKLAHIAAKFGHKELLKELHDRGIDMGVVNVTGKTPFHLAAKGGRLEAISQLLSLGVDIEVQDHYRQTALHLASTRGHKDVVELLLKNGAAVDAEDIDMQTPLHMSALQGQVQVASMLLKYGANIHKRTRAELPTLHLAASNGHQEVISMILKHGADVMAYDSTNTTALHLAANYGYKGIAIDLLENGAEIDEKTEEGYTPLYCAAKKGHLELVNLLLERGADMELKNIKGWTALFTAIKNVRLDIIRTLIRNGADIHTKDNESWTVLHRAASWGDPEVVKILLDMGCKIDAQNLDGNTPIMIGTRCDEPGVVSVLLEYGADINTTDRAGNTLLHVAVIDGHDDMVKMLLTNGAAMSDADSNRISLLYIAAELGHESIVEIALNHETGSMSTGESYTTKSLHRAAELGHIQVVKFLLNATVNVNVTDEIGETALHKACKSGQTQMVLTLLENGAYLEARDLVHGHTPLFVAAAHPEVISVLLANKANVESTSKTGGKVLHHYSAEGHVNGLFLLLNYGCNIESKNKEGWTALHFATSNSCLDVVKVLLQRDIEPDISNVVGETALRMAVDNNNIEITEQLIEYGADINARMGEYRETALHHAVCKNNKGMVRWLIYRGANIDIQDKAGMTALHMAVVESHVSMVLLLLHKGANINVPSRSGYSPLRLAVQLDNLEIGRILVKYGATMDDIPDDVNSVMTNYLKEYAQRRCRKTNQIPIIQQPKEQLIATNDVPINVSRVDELWVDYCLNSVDSSQDTKIAPNILSASVIEHKYIRGFPKWKRLDQDSLPPQDEDELLLTKKGLRRARSKSGSQPFRRRSFQPYSPDEISSSIKNVTLSSLLKAPYPHFNIDKWATQVIGNLMTWADCKLYGNHFLFYLKLFGQRQGLTPQWAFQFDRIKGIIREPGIFLVEIPQKPTKLSVPNWYESDNHVLRFINSIYVCRMASKAVNTEVFSDVLGSPEERLSTKVHATLMAGLAIVGIVGGHHNVEKLVKAILDAGPAEGLYLPPPKLHDWQIRERIKCACQTRFTHGPLSPVAAAKAIGLDIWLRRENHIVPRVWDLQDDKLVEGRDVRTVVFITHCWLRFEVEYPEVSKADVVSPNGISSKSRKLKGIREALLPYTRYVWMDTICIDKSNLSELDQSLRSMHNWYSNCSAVVLDAGTRLRKWRTRGWCFQEGNSAGSLYAILDKNLVSMQQLAKKQNRYLCKLDLSIYYQPGNAVKILARMDRRKTKRPEDMSYTMMGVFGVSISLMYGEGDAARRRLLEALATQRGDLSFLSFPSMISDIGYYLPETRHRYYLVAKCDVASAQVLTSHSGMMIPVELVNLEDADQVISALESLKTMKKVSKGRYMGITTFLKEVEDTRSNHSKTIVIAIVRDIKSVMLIETEGQDLLTSSGRFLKCFHRLHCCQVENLEFDRLFKDINVHRECIWLGNNSQTSSLRSYD